MKLYRNAAYRKGTALSIPGLLEHLGATIRQCDQWLKSGHLDNAIKYQHQSIGIIEILEVYLHGSCGSSQYQDLVWTNGWCAVGENELDKRLSILKAYAKKHKLIPKNWHEDEYHIQ